MRTKWWFVALAIGCVTPMAVQAKGGLVACVGDSITYGSGTTNPATEGYPAQLERMLLQQDTAWKVLNCGVGGTTLLHRGDKPYIRETAYQNALASLPDVVTIKLGTNDSKPQNWAYKADFISDYCALIDAFRALPNRPQVWICKPVPAAYENFSIRPPVIQNEILPLIEEIGRLKGVPVIDLFTPMLDHLNLFPDGIHPNTQGAQIIAQSLLPYFTSMPIVRDFNQDGVVNGIDFACLAQRWGESEPSIDIAPPAGDGVVNVLDLAEWCNYWMTYPGMVTHWPLDEATGDLAMDRLRHFNGTLHGSPVWQPTTGMFEGALQLDGIDDYVSTGTALKSSEGPFTVFVWVKGGQPGQVILSQSNSSGQGTLWLGTDAATGAVRTALTDSGRFTTPLLSTSSITDGNWHSLRLVWDGSHRSLYVNDQEAVTDKRVLGRLNYSGTQDVGRGENRPPRSAFVVGEIDGGDGSLNATHALKTDDLHTGGVTDTAELPGVDHITHYLPFVWVARTRVDFDPAIFVP